MWEILIEICKKHEVRDDFVAECLYDYLLKYCKKDDVFLNDLLGFIQDWR